MVHGVTKRQTRLSDQVPMHAHGLDTKRLKQTNPNSPSKELRAKVGCREQK